jgi:hypothetical protein
MTPEILPLRRRYDRATPWPFDAAVSIAESLIIDDNRSIHDDFRKIRSA